MKELIEAWLVKRAAPGAGQMVTDAKGRQRWEWTTAAPAQPNAPMPAAPRGALTTFSSQAQDPDWDRPRRLRAIPYQQRKRRWDLARRRHGKEAGPTPRTPRELAPYVKAAPEGDLAKRQAGQPLSEKEIEQRRAAAKASAEKRRRGGGAAVAQGEGPPAARDLMTHTWTELSQDEKVQAVRQGRQPKWAEYSDDEKRQAWMTVGVSAGAGAAIPAGFAAKDGVVAGKERLGAARMYAQAVQARREFNAGEAKAVNAAVDEQAGDLRGRVAAGEKLVFRGAPAADPTPQRRRYNAVYFAQNPKISEGYAGRTAHPSVPEGRRAGWMGAYALKPGTRLAPTDSSQNKTELGQKLAAAQMRHDERRSALRLANGDWAFRADPGDGARYYVYSDAQTKVAGAHGRPATMGELREIGRGVREKVAARAARDPSRALYDAHVDPKPLLDRYLRRRGYHGTMGQTGNIALHVDNRIRYLRDLPEALAVQGSEERYERMRAKSGVWYDGGLPRAVTEGDRARRDALRLARLRRFGRSALRLFRKAEPVGDLAKRQAGQPLSEKEVEQRRAAAKASAEKRRRGGGAAVAQGEAGPVDVVTATWGSLTDEQKLAAYEQGRRPAWSELSDDEKRQTVKVLAAAGAGAVAIAGAVPAGEAVKNAVEDGLLRVKGARVYAQTVQGHRRYHGGEQAAMHEAVEAQAGRLRQKMKPGERMVFRGAPQADPSPARRQYNAVYFAQTPLVSEGYAGRRGPGTEKAGWMGVFALAPDTKLARTDRSQNESETGRRLAEAQHRANRLGGITLASGHKAHRAEATDDARWYVFEVGQGSAGSRPATMAELAEIGRQNRAAPLDPKHVSGALGSAHVDPEKLFDRYLRRLGYHGTVGQSGNIALHDEKRVRFLGELPEAVQIKGHEERYARFLEDIMPAGSLFGSWKPLHGKEGRARRDALRLARLRRLGRSALRLFRKGDPEGDLAKRGTLSEAEHAQRVAAGKASAEKRRRGSVPGAPKLASNRRVYGYYIPDPKDREWRDAPDADQAGEETPGAGVFAEMRFTPQIPKALGYEKTAELVSWAGARTRDPELRADIIERAGRKGLLPGMGNRHKEEPLDPRDLRVALNHARRVALSDVGVGKYEFRFNPEHAERFKPLGEKKGFLWYARRRMANALREERPGAWAPFRDEFGKPFADARGYVKDTRGQKAGQEKKALDRHNYLVKAWGGQLADALRA